MGNVPALVCTTVRKSAIKSNYYADESVPTIHYFLSVSLEVQDDFKFFANAFVMTMLYMSILVRQILFHSNTQESATTLIYHTCATARNSGMASFVFAPRNYRRRSENAVLIEKDRTSKSWTNFRHPSSHPRYIIRRYGGSSFTVAYCLKATRPKWKRSAGAFDNFARIAWSGVSAYIPALQCNHSTLAAKNDSGVYTIWQ